MLNKGKIVGTAVTILVALAIFSVSVLTSIRPHRVFSYSPIVLSEKTENIKVTTIDYLLPYPGKINPDSPFWYAKVVRDKALLAITFNKNKKAELNLLFSDKRLGSAVLLFKNNKPDLGFSTLTKSTKYLEKSIMLIGEDKELYSKIALSSLKHREVIENEILPICPEDLRPEVIKQGNRFDEIYKKMREKMLLIGLVPPVNPFELK